ncbi:hypothetical protein G9A89_017305 [Geosiphon pyriformis]|nr:hypothetical protein G9A89_017305 [Geosiphon pyriformis]
MVSYMRASHPVILVCTQVESEAEPSELDQKNTRIVAKKGKKNKIKNIFDQYANITTALQQKSNFSRAAYTVDMTDYFIGIGSIRDI